MPDPDDAALGEAVETARDVAKRLAAIGGWIATRDEALQLATMVLVLVPEVRRLREECDGRGRMFTMVTDRLQECVTKHDLGLGGERVDELVCDEVDRLAVEGESKDVTIAQLESDLAAARAELVRVREEEHSRWRAETDRLIQERDWLLSRVDEITEAFAKYTASEVHPIVITLPPSAALPDGVRSGEWGPADLASTPKGWIGKDRS